MASLKTFVVEPVGPEAAGLSRMLREIGHDVCGVAQDISQLAALFERHTPDLIALDLQLDHGNEGLGLATVLQATGPIPIVFVAAAADGPDREGIRSIEGTALLIRPFAAPELRTAIALAFERALAAREGGAAGLSGDAGRRR
jgi:CheY-like chemotaxis protein